MTDSLMVESGRRILMRKIFKKFWQRVALQVIFVRVSFKMFVKRGENTVVEWVVWEFCTN